MRRVEQRAEIVIGGDLDQDVDLAFLTELLGEQPTKLWRQGELHPRNRNPRRRSAWIWETADVVDYDSEAVLGVVLDKFEAHSDAIRDVCARHEVEVGLGLVVTMYGDITPDDEDGTLGADVGTPALHFTFETLRRVVALGASIDVDQYVIAPDSEQPARTG